MKRIGTALTIVFIIAGFAISFFIGHYVSDKSHTESRAAQFDKYISVRLIQSKIKVCPLMAPQKR